MGGPCNFTGDATGQGVCGELGLRAEGFALQHSLGDAALYVWALVGTFPELSRKLPVGDAALRGWKIRPGGRLGLNLVRVNRVNELFSE